MAWRAGHLPRGSKYPNTEVLGPKGYTYDQRWLLGPYAGTWGTWRLWAIQDIADEAACNYPFEAPAKIVRGMHALFDGLWVLGAESLWQAWPLGCAAPLLCVHGLS